MLMRIKQGLRARLGLNLALFCILFLGALTVAVHIVTKAQEEVLIDRIVADEMATLIDKHHVTPSLRVLHGHGTYGYVVQTDGDRRSLPGYLQSLGDGTHDINDGQKVLRVAIRFVTGSTYYLAYDITHHQQRVAEFAWMLLRGVLAMALVALVLGFWWSGQIIRQLAELAQRLDQSRPRVDAATSADATTDDQLARLVLAFDNYQTKMLEVIEREKEFSANVSHELRTPLTLIQTSCELLAQDKGLSEKSRRLVESIAFGSEHMAELIRWFMVLAREGSLGASERLSVAGCVHEACGPLRATLESKGLYLHELMPPGAEVYANRDALYLVLTNLLRNAVEYTDRGGITVRYLGNKLHIEDTGRGIAESELSSIFLRFYRVEASRRQRDGLGLGLAIVKRICDHYEWRVNVKSVVNSGTTISVEFPFPANLF